jgi:hypothetical protein
MGKIKEIKHLKIRPLSGKNPAKITKIRLQICPTAYLFIPPFLSFAAEISASCAPFLSPPPLPLPPLSNPHLHTSLSEPDFLNF